MATDCAILVAVIMKFGINILIWSGAFDPNLPYGAMKEAGADGIEIPAFDPGGFNPADVRRVCSEHDLDVTFCSVHGEGCNPISDSEADRDRAVEHWTRVIHVIAESGANLLAGPSQAPVGYLPGRRRTDDEWKRCVEFHQRLDPVLADAGVELAIEPLNRFETYALNLASDAYQLCEEIGSPRIGILCDTFHSNIEEKSIPGAYRTCGKHLKHVHTCENDRGIPGSGHVPWADVLRTLAAMNYDGWLTIESFNSQIADIAAATAIWRELAPKTDDIALDGVKFLREMWAGISG